MISYHAHFSARETQGQDPRPGIFDMDPTIFSLTGIFFPRTRFFHRQDDPLEFSLGFFHRQDDPFM